MTLSARPLLQHRMALAIAAIIVLDRFAKAFARSGARADVPFARFALYENRGIVFSITAPRALIISFSIAILLGIGVWLIKRVSPSPAERWGAALILAGGASNLFDRIAYGAAIDYLSLEPIARWVNLADGMILAGVLALVMRHARKHRSPPTNQRPQAIRGF